jgi:CRP-like cAMP-binding protein
MEPSIVVSLRREDLEALIWSNTSVLLQMIRSLSERLKRCETRLEEDVALKKIPARLASQILELAERGAAPIGKAISCAAKHGIRVRRS